MWSLNKGYVVIKLRMFGHYIKSVCTDKRLVNSPAIAEVDDSNPTETTSVTQL